MKLTKIEIDLIEEMKNQGADKQTINIVMNLLQTETHYKLMMNYLIKIRQKSVNKNQIILTAVKYVEEN